VIPCYNYAQYLNDAIESALCQHGVDVEVVVVDDASNDGSREIAERWSADDSRVRVVCHHVNHGHIATFNEALALATAPYVVKLDADDVLTPGSLRRSVDVFEAVPEVVLVYGGVQHFRGSIPSNVPVRPYAWRVWSGEHWLMVIARRVRNPLSQPEIMIRRAALQCVGGHREAVPATSDLNLWLRLASIGSIARIEGAVQGLYRVHDTSMRATIHSGLLLDVRARRDAFELFLEEAGGNLRDAERFRRTMRKALARDAVTNAFLDFEAGRDPTELLEEAISIDESIVRTRGWRSIQRQRRRGTHRLWWAWFGRSVRDIGQRLRWRTWRRWGI